MASNRALRPGYRMAVPCRARVHTDTFDPIPNVSWLNGDETTLFTKPLLGTLEPPLHIPLPLLGNIAGVVLDKTLGHGSESRFITPLSLWPGGYRRHLARLNVLQDFPEEDSGLVRIRRSSA